MTRKAVKIIEKLLASNEHAVLPGFGGFIVQHQSAIITDRGIIPPQSSISFNPLLEHNDGMFIIQFSRTNKISYKEAARQTALFIKEIKQKLEQENELDFGSIGKFQKHNDGHIAFTPNVVADFLPANFGYKEVLLPKKHEESKSVKLNIPTQKLMRYAAILVAFVALFFSTNLNQFTDTIQADFSKLLKFDLPEIMVTSDLGTTTTTAMATRTTATNEHTSNKKTENSHSAYKLVVATFQTQEKATSYKDELKAGEYPDAEIIVSNSNTKVAIKSFNSIVAAVNYMEEIRHLDRKFSDAWVMKTNTSPN